MIKDKKVLKSFSRIFVVSLSSYFAMNVVNAYLVHALGHATYGDYSLAISLVFSLIPLFSIGIINLLIKFIPSYIEENLTSKINVFLKWSITILMKSIILILVLIVAMIILRVTVFNQSIAQIVPCLKVSCAYNRHFMEDFLFILPLALLLVWNETLLEATKNPLSSNVFSAGKVTYLTAFLIFIFGFFYDTLTHDKIVLAAFLAFLIVCLAQYGVIYHLLIKTKTLSMNGITRQHVEKQVRLSYLKSGISLMFNNIIYSAMGVIDMLMIEWLSPNEVVLGYYVIIMKISSIVGVLGSSIYFIMDPYLSDLKSSSRLSDLQKTLNLNVILTAVWLIICIAVFLIFKKIIFKLYDINFNYAGFAIILTFISGAIFSVTGVSEEICLYNDMNKRLYPISIIQLIMIGLLSYILIPHFSYLGAIFSFIITEVFCSLVCWFMVRRHGIKVKIFGFI